MKHDSILDDLSQRGLLKQTTADSALREHLATPRTLYCGFDPTAPSLHVGNLVPLLGLRRFQRAGHRPILLVGGATGLIGDPGGKASERQLNPRDTVAAWAASVRAQAEQFLEFEGESGALVVDNYDWISRMDVIGFLRDIGKRFSVNAMIQKESVRERIARDEQGISYTEFSYQVLQSLDYLELHRTHGCTLQIGGSDQWGNITSGMDLIRRDSGAEVYGLTFPLITKSDGSKFGKSEGGSIWLDPTMTSPYSFYQFWLNTADADVATFLDYFSFREVEERALLIESLRIAPEQREAQRALAQEMTALVHGDSAVASSERIAAALFGGDLATLTATDLAQLAQDGLPVVRVESGAESLATLLSDAGLAPSRSQARKLVKSGGVRVNGAVIDNEEFEVSADGALVDGYSLVRRGKRNWVLVRFGAD